MLETNHLMKSILIFHLLVPKCRSTKGVTNKHFWERILFPRTGKSEMISPFRMRAVCLLPPPPTTPLLHPREEEETGGSPRVPT